MSRYIDADKLKQDLDAWAINLHKPTNLVREDTFVIIDEQPAADIVEVRHGHWILCRPNSLHLDWRDSLFECSVCRMNRIRRTGEVLNYCPYCGARMDGEEHETSK